MQSFDRSARSQRRCSSGPSAAHVAVHGDRVYLAAYKGKRILVYDAADGSPVGVRDERDAVLFVDSPIALAVNSDRTLLWVACDDDYVRGYQLKPDGTLDKIVAQVGGYGEGAVGGEGAELEGDAGGLYEARAGMGLWQLKRLSKDVAGGVGSGYTLGPV